MEKQSLLFIAILPSPAIQREITAMKQYIAQKWGPRHALKSPPHITLYPPFWKKAELRHRLSNCISVFSQNQMPFEVALRDFGAFAPKVFFIQPEHSEPLTHLYTQLMEVLEKQLGMKTKHAARSFHPHLTLAHRDVEPLVFKQISADFRQRSYRRVFEVRSLTLLEWTSECWKIAEEFPFGTGAQ